MKRKIVPGDFARPFWTNGNSPRPSLEPLRIVSGVSSPCARRPASNQPNTNASRSRSLRMREDVEPKLDIRNASKSNISAAPRHDKSSFSRSTITDDPIQPQVPFGLSQSSLTSTERRIFKQIARNFGATIPGLSHPQPSILAQRPLETEPRSNQLTTQKLPLHQLEVDSILRLFAPIPKDREPHQRPLEAEPSNVTFTTFSPSPKTSEPSPDDANPIKDTQTITPPKAPASINQQIYTAAQTALSQIAQQIRSTLRSNTPDKTLWSYLQTSILQIVTLLQHPSLRPNGQQSAFHRPYDLTIGDLIATSDPITIPPTLANITPSIPLIPLVTILYPAATLLAMRSFAAYHPSSPYPMALLPAIKAFGPTSYLLAGNMHFYNVLLQLQWEVYLDIHAIETLLREMTMNAVGFNEHTLAVVKAVDTYEFDRDGRGQGISTNKLLLRKMAGLRETWIPTIESTINTMEV